MSFVSYAQNFEDVMLWRALKHIENGYYIDIGAQHPVIDSVSLAFYEHGWRGAHVEPTRQYSSLLRAARPDETVFQLAIGNQNCSLKFFEFEDTGLSTADPEIAHRHKTDGFECQETLVPFLSLDGLLQQVDVQDIHWLKVDVEGLEKAVLESWQDCPRRPWIIVIESTSPGSQKKSHQNWEALLVAKGYSYVYFDGLNRFYVSPDHPELLDAFESPPNIFDDFALSGSASQPFCRLLNSISQEAKSRADQAEIRAEQAEIRAEQAEIRAEQAKSNAAQAEIRAQHAAANAQNSEFVLEALYRSSSWRITKPLRWLAVQARLLSKYGFMARAAAFIRKVRLLILGHLANWISERPHLRQKLIVVAKRVGAYAGLRELYMGLQKPDARGFCVSTYAAPPELSQMTLRARQVYTDLNAAILHVKKESN